MQFENFDNKVKQAAEQHHPSYDEKAWAKMEKLLDIHLPRNDDRRRRVIFLLLSFLLLGGSTWIIIDKPWQQEKSAGSYEDNARKKAAVTSSSGSAKAISKEAKPVDLAGKPVNNEEQRVLIEQPAIENPVITGNVKEGVVITRGNKPGKGQQIVNSKKQLQDDSYQVNIEPGSTGKTDKSGKDVVSSDNIQKAGNTSENNTIISPQDNKKTQQDNKVKDPADLTVNDNKATDKSKTPEKGITNQQPAVVEKKMAKKSRNQSNVFFLSLSAGPDVSSVGMDDLGKIKLVGGAGFGYTFNRWTLRTGFYKGRKVYSANKEEYKPSVSVPNYPYLDKINADCKVYEIPLSVAYNFGQSGKNSWFAAAGLSSYIMKKEVYNYIYHGYSGWPPPPTYTKTVNNENKHYFSVLSLSAGYQRRISRTFSVAAEPYFKLPLSGIGFGHVKLNSTGVLFSLNINLFQPSVKR